MIGRSRPDEVTALGLLLDRTYTETAEAGAHPHRLDRTFLVGQFQLWADHVRPAVAAAAAPRRSRRSAARAVWHSLAQQARPEHRSWMRTHLTALGIDADALLTGAASAPRGPSAGRLADLCTLQYLGFRRLRRMHHVGNLRRWELAAAGTLCAGLGSATIRAASVVGAGRRNRRADRLLRALTADTAGPAHAYLKTIGFVRPESADEPAHPRPARITVGTAGRLFDRLDVSDARLRLVAGTDPLLVQLDVRRADADRDTIVVLTLHGPEAAAPLDVPVAGLALTGPPTIAATADDVSVSIPLAGGDWTVRAAAGTFYTD